MPAFPPLASQLFNNLPTSLNDTGFVIKRSTPLVKASLWSLDEARPVSAMISAGAESDGTPFRRDASIWRIARVASKPFITGIDISVIRVFSQHHEDKYRAVLRSEAYP